MGSRFPREVAATRWGSPTSSTASGSRRRKTPSTIASGMLPITARTFMAASRPMGSFSICGHFLRRLPRCRCRANVYVTNLANGRTLLLRVNDRGPYVKSRLIDVSKAAARYLGFEARGTTQVRVRYGGPAPLSGEDRAEQRFLAN